MGRMKLEIRKLEQNNSRQITYSKRRNGIVKKAKELAILCDIDIFLIMFSPSGKPTVCVGQKSTMEEVIEKFCRLTPQERRKRKVESLEALKKTFKKTNHVVDFEDFLESSPQKLEDLKVELANIKTEVLSLQEKTRNFWDQRHQVNNLTLEQTRVTEESILEKLAQVRVRKEVLRSSLTMETTQASEEYYNGEHNLSSIEFLKQPVGVHFPSISGQLIVSHEDPNIRTGQRDTEYFGDGVFPVPDYLCNYKQSIVDDGSCNNLVLNMANRYGLSSFIGYPGSSCLPSLISNQPLLLEESDHKQEMTLTSTPIDNSSQFFATSIDALPQQWSSNCNHTIESLYDGLLYSWQHSTSVSDASSSSTSQQIDTFGQQEQLPNEPLQTTYGSAIGIQDMEPIV